MKRNPAGGSRPWRKWILGVAVVLACTGVAALLHRRLESANLVMVYLLGVMGIALGLGRGPAVMASFLSVALFDFFFVPPPLTFAVSDVQYVVTLGVMLLAAVLVGSLATRLRERAHAAQVEARRSRALARLSGELVYARDRGATLEASMRHLEEVFQGRAVAFLPRPGGRLEAVLGDEALLDPRGRERGEAQWVLDAGEAAGLGTPRLPGSRCLHLPLRGSGEALGVITLVPADTGRVPDADAVGLLEAFANQTALALERWDLAERAESARVHSETERLRSALLSSISHDLRTPLAAITGAASALLEDGNSLAAPERREMLRTVADEAGRLNRLVANLLEMTRLQAGTLEVKRSWHSIEEIIGAALRRVEPLVGGRPIRTTLERDLPLVAIDDVLIEQVVFNLVENALKHASSQAPIEVAARRTPDGVEVSVADRGPGIPAGTEEQLFEKFYRGEGSSRAGGAGLGLAICRGIVEAHEGRIKAVNRPGGGAVFAFMLPLGGEPPAIEPESAEPAELEGHVDSVRER